ncbi:MAG: tellurite resistance TerB C-terminal domain-containing protein, partial [Planctomycetota bacterium]
NNSIMNRVVPQRHPDVLLSLFKKRFSRLKNQESWLTNLGEQQIHRYGLLNHTLLGLLNVTDYELTCQGITCSDAFRESMIDLIEECVESLAPFDRQFRKAGGQWTDEVRAALPPELQMPAEPQPELQIDRDAIRGIQQQTRAVSKVLDREFQEDNSEDKDESKQASSHVPLTSTLPQHPNADVIEDADEASNSTETPADLPQRIAPFFQELIRRPEWSLSEIRSLASCHNVMLDGTIELINEWSTEQFDDWIVIEGDPYEIQTNLLQQ